MNGHSTNDIGTFELHIPSPSTSSGPSIYQSPRIILNVAVLKQHRLKTGDLLLAQSESTNFIVGIAWPSLDLLPHLVTITGETQGLESHTRITVTRLQAGSLHIATRISVMETDVMTRYEEANQTSVAWLKTAILECLVEKRYIWKDRVFELVWEGQPKTFCITDMRIGNKTEQPIVDNMKMLSISDSSSQKEPDVWTVDWHSEIEISQPPSRSVAVANGVEESLPQKSSAYESVGGLQKQISLIRDLIEIPMIHPELFTHFNLKPPRGLLLHGPPGTGKTHLARAIAAATGSSVIVVNGPELSSAYHGETEKKLREVFEKAERSSPSIVVLDEVDAICPKRDSEGDGGEVSKRVVATLLTILDGMGEHRATKNKEPTREGRVVIVATTNRPNSIDPALRRPGRFDRELEIGIPDAAARLDILRVLLRKTPHDLNEEQLQILASQSHGYVGADLAGLVREAGTLAIKRLMQGSEQETISSGFVSYSDFHHALPTIRPSALRSLIIETPKVYWSDIGGVSHIRDKLKEAVEWPLLHAEAFARLGVSPTKGVLLYGPPGCSKTLTAKALATESGINFLAVKGPELLSKFVGESERAVREIFAKARAGAPCIVFFDEIDALGATRSEDRISTAHEGVLTSMLNEMDGIQDLHGVIIVGATNRPDAIDSALMRPGRLDRILYVGPPDQAGREEILRIQTRKMTVEQGVNFEELALLTEGCSGAELAAMCQEAAMKTMRENISAEFVSREHLILAARGARRGITPDVVLKFERWRRASGLTEV